MRNPSTETLPVESECRDTLASEEHRRHAFTRGSRDVTSEATMGALLGILSGAPPAEQCRLIDCYTHPLPHRLGVAAAETEGRRDRLKSNRQASLGRENSSTTSDGSRESAASTTPCRRQARGNIVASERAFKKRAQKDVASRRRADRRQKAKPSRDDGSETEDENQESDVDEVSNLLKEMETRGGRPDLRSRAVPECFLADIRETLKMKAVKTSISEVRPPKKFASGQHLRIAARSDKGNMCHHVARLIPAPYTSRLPPVAAEFSTPRPA